MLDELDRTIDAHSEAAFSFLAELVTAPSVVGSEQAALEIFSRQMEDIGLITQRLPFSNTPMADARAGIAPSVKNVSADRYQVLATTPGNSPLTVLLNGHMDVVPATTPELWTSPPFTPERRNGRMFGRGAGDMKGGFAIGYLALRALRDVEPQLFADRRLGFLAVIEEECTGNGTLRSIVDHDVHAEEVVLLEPTDLGLMLGGVGVIWIDISVTASSAHAQSAHSHANAVDLGMRLVQVLRDWAQTLTRSHPEPSMSPEDNPYNVNLGTVHSGDWTSTAPASAVFSVRVGFPREWSPDRAEAEIRSLISSTATGDPDFPRQPRVELSGLRAQGYLLDFDSALVRDLRAAHLDAHGELPVNFSLGSTTDARTYLNSFGVPAVCFGAIAHDMHGIDESVELESIVAAARTLSRFLLVRFGQPVVSR